MKPQVNFFIVCFCFICFTVSAEEISIDEYLDLVKKNHPFFTKEDLSTQIEEKEAESLLGAQDWMLSIEPSYSYLGKSSAPEYGAQNRIHQVGVTAGVNRSLWSTGGQLGLSFSSGYKNSDTYPSTTKAFRHGFGVSYTHPFLQNSKGKLDRLAYELSDYTIDLTEVGALENKEDFLLDAATRFLDWVYYTEAIKIAEERLSLAEEQLEQTTKKLKANLVDKVDVLRAEDSVRISEQALIQLESQWKAKQAELAVLAVTDEIYERIPLYDLYSLEQLPKKEEAVSTLKAQSRLLKTFDILRKQLIHQRDGLEEQARAQLDFTVSGGLYGRDEDFMRSLEIYRPDASVSLVYSKPLGNRAVKAKIEKIDLQIKQIEEDKQNIGVGLEASLASLFIQITEFEKVLVLNQAQIKSAEEKTKEEIKLYERGRSQLTFVIQSRDNEENAKLLYTENAALYQSLLWQYRALLDVLLGDE